MRNSTGVCLGQSHLQGILLQQFGFDTSILGISLEATVR